MASADAIIAGFDTKYTYNFWRPVTAIRAADTDSNPDTAADLTWTPLVVTPRHPDYISNHCIYSAAAAKVLSSIFHGDHFAFSIASSTAPGAVRSYHSFSQAAKEVADARVWVGFHFRTGCRVGLKQGKEVGRFAFKNYLKRVNKHDQDDDDEEDDDN
jgi:hypothetical protein